MSYSGLTAAAAKAAIVDAGLEEQFLKVTGLSSLDELSPDNFSSNFGKADSLMKSVQLPSAAPSSLPTTQKSDGDAKKADGYQEASDYLQGFKDLTIRFPPKKKASAFIPSSVVMYLLIHIMNNILVDHFYFKRSAPDYHPGLLRLYFGIVFIIQTLRAQHASDRLQNTRQYEFLKRFLDSFPCESLPIPAPLMHVFKSLCASKCEIPQYGYVTPYLPEVLGGLLNLGYGGNQMNYLLPDIAGILSMIHAQGSTSDTNTRDKKGFKPAFSTTADTEFRGYTFDKTHASWSDIAAWSLTCPGLEHPFESGKALNKDFFEDRYDDLDLPKPKATNNTTYVDSYCFLTGDYTWFSRIRDVASVVCKFFPGSGSLADCPAIGLPTGQIQFRQVAPDTLPTKPTDFPGTSSTNMSMKFQLTTSSRTISQLPIIMAGASGINFRTYATHPYMPTIMSRVDGPFWDIRPLERSATEEDRFFSMTDAMKKAVKDKA